MQQQQDKQVCKHENKTCPRCSVVFECKVGDITRCQCYSVKLNDVQRDFLSHHYADCLCAACMKEIARLVDWPIAD